ncbi:MAG TPA: type IX secretion system sortase PorU, partial [Bacteroidales bacterium]|nr:type IX secretion system sortase PorU [Bacteroidales bacterium]
MRYLLILFIFLSNSVISQELVFERSINWKSSRKADEKRESNGESFTRRKYLHFENAVYKNTETLFPYYNELIPLPDYYHQSQINIRDVECQPVASGELEDVIMLDELSSDFVFNTYQTSDRKIRSVSLSVLPLRKSPNTNIIEKLTSFSIEIIPGEAPSGISDMSKAAGVTYQEISVLSTGEWFKISIQKSGVYKLTYNDLAELGISNPENVRIYGNGGKILPLMNNESRPDDLTENAIYMEKGADGTFNTGDYILFYGQGVVTWEFDQTQQLFRHSVNEYSAYSYYFLTSSFGPGKRMESVSILAEPADTIITSFDDYDYHERNLYNLIQSGHQWFGEKFDYSTSFDTTFLFPNLVTTSPVILIANVASRSSDTRNFNIKINDQYNEYISVGSIDLTDNVGTFAKQNARLIQFLSSGDNIALKITYDKDESSDEGYLDYITINARRNLALTTKPLFFRDSQSVKPGKIAEFRIQNADAQTIIWDITDINNVRRMGVSAYAGGMAFKSNVDELKEYVAFNDNTEFLIPKIDKSNAHIDNQNLHGTAPHKMLIVTHPEFLSQAERLAEFHRTKDNFSVFVITTDKIYNEFASGMPDISAIRDFTRMLYDRSQEDENALKFLLLFGDGSYNNFSKNEGNPNFVPTYQSSNSMTYTHSYVSDDFYGFLDFNEGGSDSMAYYLLDIGIGRLPVGDTTEAKIVVDKVIDYNASSTMQDWRNKLLFIGDDEEGNTHMDQANNLADYIRSNYPGFVVKKILLDAYKQVASSSGNRYPDVNQAILDNFNKGILIFNYTGHGSENGIAEEQILLKQDIEKLNNKGKYPLFITATCEFSRWDNMIIDEKDGKFKEQSSAGEAALLNANGGAIALLSTTRVVYSHLNHYLNQNFYYKAFLSDEKGQPYRMGDVIRLTKNAVGQDRNKLNFTLLGDPALRLAYPEYQVMTDSINGMNIAQPLDTLKAFKEITVSGHIVNQDNILLESFGGTVYPFVFDKVQTLQTLANDPNQSPLTFSVQENLLFKGRASVTNGRFEFSFIVPKDISYNIGKGKINYYAQNGSIDAHGHYSEFLIGGTSDQLSGDFTGPGIELYLNDENFRNGGITDKDPKIFARVWDENGINTTGNGIGHDIIGVLDGNTNNPIVLNDYYQTSQDNYQGGEVIYQLNDLAAGYHTLSVKIWDVFNNSSDRLITFKVINSSDLILEQVFNFPNPLTDNTFFQFEHNMPDQNLTIRIDIFDFSGRLIYSISRESFAGGYRSEPIEWDGRGMNGNKIPRGIYPYRVAIESGEGH